MRLAIPKHVCHQTCLVACQGGGCKQPRLSCIHSRVLQSIMQPFTDYMRCSKEPCELPGGV
jgi:hypothetical protein